MVTPPPIIQPGNPARPAVPANSEAALFQFVIVRPPAQLLQPANSTIRYQPGYGSALVAALTHQPTASSAGQAEALASAAPADPAAGASASADQLRATLLELAHLAQFGSWLREYQRSLTKEAVDQAQQQLQPLAATPAQLGQVWEGLVRATVTGNTQANQEPLLAVLRAQHFLDHQAEAGDDVLALRTLAAAEVLLPAGILPPARAVAAAPTRPNTTTASDALQTQASQQQRLAACEQALTELRRLRDVRLEEVRNTPLPTTPADLSKAVPTAEDQALAQNYAAAQRRADFIGDNANLTPATAALVAALGSPTALRTTFIIEQLEAQAAQLAQQLSQGAAVLRPVFQVGGTLWAEQTPQEVILQGAGRDAQLALEQASNPGQTPPAALQEPAASVAGADFTTRDFTARDFSTGDPSATSSATSSADDPYAGFYPATTGPAPGRIRPLGIADLNRVEQTLCCYKAGEVAHIENVMQGEYKERATRHLTRSELTLDLTTESESTRERDTTTTDRYELTQETSRVLQENSSLSAGISASASFGPVTVAASSNFATSSTSTDSDHQTSAYAKNITDRSLQRIVERVRTQRTSKLTEEFEENNKHGLDNRGGAKHVVGLYRWVDKLYRAQVVNYGRRLLFEFMVPEPGNFHLWAMSRSATQASLSLALPVDPRTTALAGQASPLSSAQALTPTNYLAWAAAYGASVTPPPAETVVVSLAVNGSKTPIERFSNTIMAGTADGLQVPEGYVATSAKLNAEFQDYGGDDGVHPNAIISVGDAGVWFVEGGALNGGAPRASWQTVTLAPLTGKIAVSYGVAYSERFTANIVLTCTRTAATLDAWRIKTFQAIIDAYQGQQTTYDQALADAQARAAGEVNTIQGTNPAINQQLITNELKKGCLNWLFQGQQYGTYAVWRYGDPVNPPHYSTDAPAAADGERAKFMEQCFEWELMTYTLYPYYWANQGRWRPLYQLSDPDPLLLGFLQSGMARVLVSVRPGYEKAAMYFLSTGQIWNGGDQPGLDSPIYRSVVDELKQPVGVRVGEPWEIRVPTTLTVLQAESGAIDGKGLPCDCEPTAGLGATASLLTSKS